ncbi:MAG: S41 family peptidase [Anaerolineae bacterium]
MTKETRKALMAQITVPTREDTETIAADDYPALTEQACGIVRDNYVRDNYNGVDWEATCQRYLEMAANVQTQDEFWALMADFIHELGDNHSRFVRPDRFAAEFDLPSEGSGRPWPGLSFWPAREDEYLLIWDVCQVGPAADAGLHRGDVVTAINGHTFERGEDGTNYREVVTALYEKDDSATLTVIQGEGQEPKEITVPFGGAGGCDGWAAGLISEIPRIGYIRIPDFGGDSDTNILTAINDMETDAPLDGLILDIRHNPGGNSDRDAAIFTQGEFGLVGSLRSDATQTIYRIRGPVKWNETTPLAVLTDGNSHSAADYFAAVMRWSGRATLVGMPSAGNTEGISGFNLADGSLIRLAVSTLQLPDGNTFEGVGILPDIEVPLGQFGLRQTPDVQLQAAIDALLAQIGE